MALLRNRDASGATIRRLRPARRTGQLAAISGTGGLAIDPDGTHRIWLDYELS
jgi:hypothetical protein